MDIGTYKNEDEALAAFQLMRSHAPYRFGGEWHVSVTPSGTGVAYRNRRDLSRRMSKEFLATDQGCGSYRVLTIRSA